MAKKRTRKRKSLWTPAKGLTNSSLTKWKNCREQWSLSNIDGWSPKKISEPLMYGILWHALEEGPEELQRVITNVKKKGSPSVTAQVVALAEIVKAVFPVYKDYYEDQSFKWIGRENQFSIPLTIRGIMVPIRGKRDGEYRDSDGNLVLFETKTKTSINRKVIGEQLQSDLQTLIYSWALWKETGECPKKVLYNVIKRPKLKQKAKESRPQYLKRISDTVKDQKASYFQRWEIDITEEDIITFEKQILIPLCQAFITWWLEVRRAPFLPERTDGRHPSHFVNLNALVTGYGRSDLFDLMVLKSKAGYYIRSSVHPELDD